MSPQQAKTLASMIFGAEARVVVGKFAVNTHANQQTIAGHCGGPESKAVVVRGDRLTDDPSGCEAVAATLIVVPHARFALPPGTSWDDFLARADDFFKGTPR